MKRYWLFSWPNHEASGGMDDFINSFDSIDECKYEFENNVYYNDKPASFTMFSNFSCHIWDSFDNKIVYISYEKRKDRKIIEYGWHYLINNTYENLAPNTI